MPSARISGLLGSQTMPPDMPGRPSDKGLLLDDQRFESGIERRQRSDHPAAAAARDEQVDGLVPIGHRTSDLTRSDSPRSATGTSMVVFVFWIAGDEPLVWQAGEEAVDDALEVRDQPFDLLRQPHVLESLGVQAFLLTRQVGEVLGRDRSASSGHRAPAAPAGWVSRVNGRPGSG